MVAAVLGTDALMAMRRNLLGELRWL